MAHTRDHNYMYCEICRAPACDVCIRATKPAWSAIVRHLQAALLARWHTATS